jgi:hypothetical protein
MQQLVAFLFHIKSKGAGLNILFQHIQQPHFQNNVNNFISQILWEGVSKFSYLVPMTTVITVHDGINRIRAHTADNSVTNL